MLSRSRLVISTVLPLALVALAAHAPDASAGASRRASQQQTTPSTPTQRPPTVSVESDTQVVTVCPDNDASGQVRLRAAGNSPDGNVLRYRWTVSGGRVTGDGTDVVWDLSGAQPGTYTATVNAESGPSGDPVCQAFASTRVIVRPCPPPRPFCPNISIYCPDTVAAGQPLTFNANVGGGTPGVTPTYRWTVSEGTISSGQGTTSVTVDTAGLAGRPITAKVEVVGYELDCAASCTTQIPEPIRPRQSDEFGEIARDDEKARLDNFAIALQNAPGSQGHVLVYAARNERAGAAQRRADRIRDYLVNTRGIDSSRVVVNTAGQREESTVQLWIVPPGAAPPTP
ncbi:MAG TPA: hypothetical protein VER32_07160 [Pyrinomonadaceae bacterium]|nr:hypothetical protein [Pyrinomonadaceae bacterium]